VNACWPGAERGAAGLVLLFCAAGLWRLDSRNDIRQWVGSPPQLLQEAQAVARITGYQPTSQFFLVRGDDQQQLLERLQALSGKLGELVELGKLKGYMSLSQLVASPANNSSCNRPSASCRRTGSPCSTWACPQRAG
jgi:predicted exporter